MPLGVIFAFLGPHQFIHLHFLTSELCCSAGFWRRVSCIRQAQSSPIIALLWLQRKELLVDSAMWSKAMFPTPHGAQWVPVLVWLCDCCPKGECSFLPHWYCLLFSKHCSCTDMESQPQQGSSVPIHWQCLVEHFLLRKRSLVNRGERERVQRAKVYCKWKLREFLSSLGVMILGSK